LLLFCKPDRLQPPPELVPAEPGLPAGTGSVPAPGFPVTPRTVALVGGWGARGARASPVRTSPISGGSGWPGSAVQRWRCWQCSQHHRPLVAVPGCRVQA